MEIIKRSRQTNSLCNSCKYVDTCSAWLLIKNKYDVVACSKDPDKAKADVDTIMKGQIRKKLGGYLKDETQV